MPSISGRKEITCFICDGSKKNRIGKKSCKTCKGSGQLPVEKFSGLISAVRQEVSVFVEKSMRDLLKNQEAAKPAENVQKAAPEVRQELVEEEKQEAPIEEVK